MRKPSSHLARINGSKRSSIYGQMSDCSGVAIDFGDQRVAQLTVSSIDGSAKHKFDVDVKMFSSVSDQP